MKIHVSAERWALPLIALGLLGTFACILLVNDADPVLVGTLTTALVAVAGGIAASGGRPDNAPTEQEQL